MKNKTQLYTYWKNRLDWSEEDTYKNYKRACREIDDKNGEYRLYSQWKDDIVSLIRKGGLDNEDIIEFRAYIRFRMRQQILSKELLTGVCFAIIIGIISGLLSSVLMSPKKELDILLIQIFVGIVREGNPAYVLVLLIVLVLFIIPGFFIWFLMRQYQGPFFRIYYYEDILEIIDSILLINNSRRMC